MFGIAVDRGSQPNLNATLPENSPGQLQVNFFKLKMPAIKGTASAGRAEAVRSWDCQVTFRNR
jgi:hypothetical protein